MLMNLLVDNYVNVLMLDIDFSLFMPLIHHQRNHGLDFLVYDSVSLFIAIQAFIMLDVNLLEVLTLFFLIYLY